MSERQEPAQPKAQGIHTQAEPERLAPGELVGRDQPQHEALKQPDEQLSAEEHHQVVIREKQQQTPEQRLRQQIGETGTEQQADMSFVMPARIYADNQTLNHNRQRKRGDHFLRALRSKSRITNPARINSRDRQHPQNNKITAGER